MNNKSARTNYPQTWDELIGQTAAVEQLKVRCAAAKLRGTQLDHVLIESEIAGVGKTSLARLVAMAIGAKQLVIENEQIPARAAPFLMQKLGDGDVLLLDEAHKQFDGGKRNAEWLLTLLETGQIPTKWGLEPAPDITVIAATTDIGVFTAPFLRRFRIKPEITPYTEAEAALIVARLAEKILVAEGLIEPSPEVCAAIARAADNNPGEAENILLAMLDLELIYGVAPDSSYSISMDRAIRFAGLTPDGLTHREIAYLKLLMQAQGRPLGRQTLKEHLGEVGPGVGYLDKRLSAKGLVIAADNGRELTWAGRQRALELLDAA